MKYLIFSALLIVMTGLPAFSQGSQPQVVPASATTVLSDEDSIREVVLAKIVGPWIKTPDDKNLVAYHLETYYLAVDGDKDPSAALLKRFEGLARPIRKASESFISEPEGSVVLDKKTKKPGVLFTISKLTRVGKDQVRVSAGSYLGNMGSDGCWYTLKKENGKWEIVGQAECTIS